MRPKITLLLVLVMASMLVGTAFAECVAMNMPCCAQHHSTSCHELCATPTANISSATVPQVTVDFQAIATIVSVLPTRHPIAVHIQPAFAPSSENLLARIHVLLL